MTWTARRARTAGALVTLALMPVWAGGCGVLGAEKSPQALDPKKVPYGLLSRSEPASAFSLRHDLVAVTLYLEGANKHLERVSSYVTWPATVTALLDALARGPTAAQAGRGLVSPASAVGTFGVGPVQDGVVTIDLPASFENLGGEDQILAAAQVVFSVTTFPGIRGVHFLIGGQAVHVPNSAGQLVSGPVTPSDYASLASGH
jgi:hypothetical protein